MHDREALYRFLHEHSDTSGIVTMKQGEVAAEFGISYQALSEVMHEFIDLGMIDKNGHKFMVVYDPDKIPWDKFREHRRKYVKAKTTQGLQS